MEWLRLYHSSLDSAKIQNLPARDFKAWINLLIVASKNGDRGLLPPLSQIAFALRLSIEATRDTLLRLKSESLIDEKEGTFQMHDWTDWQYESDNVVKRVKKSRESKRIVAATVAANVSCNVTSNDKETLENRTDTDTDTEQIQKQEAEIHAFSRWSEMVYALYPKQQNKYLAEQLLAKLFGGNPAARDVFESGLRHHCDDPAWYAQTRKYGPPLCKPDGSGYIADESWKHVNARAPTVDRVSAMEKIVLEERRKEGDLNGKHRAHLTS